MSTQAAALRANPRSLLAGMLMVTLVLVFCPVGRGQTVNFGAGYTADVLGNLYGGIKPGITYMDLMNAQLRVDWQSSGTSEGPTVFVQGIGMQGTDLSEHFVGDYQIASNIEAETSWRIYQAWVQQQLADGKLSLRTGLYAVDEEFDYLRSAQLFLNSSFGTGPDFAQACWTGPSIFPISGLAVRGAYRFSSGSYIRTAIAEGIPGDPLEPRGTKIHFQSGEGLLLLTEVGHQKGPLKVAAGGWKYTRSFTTYSGGVSNAAAGGYLLAEGAPRDDISVFGRAGYANPTMHRLVAYTGGGVVATGIVEGRPDDELGFGVAAAHNGAPYRRAQRRETGRQPAAREIAFELTYRAPIWEHMAIQANSQYIVNPGTVPGRPNALVAGFRITATY